MVSLTHRILDSLLIPNFRRTVVWTKSNPTPWNEVKQDENVKMMAVNQKFDKRSALLLLLVYSSSSLT
jgi:NADH-ubiquinone reductase complex 1 MLRQ subunit